MRQLLYISTAKPALGEDNLSAILGQSLRNNALDDVTGLLWSDRLSFIQILEGPSASVREAYGRITADDRHYDLTIIRDQLVECREFGDWSMCYRRPYDTADEYDAKLDRLLSMSDSPALYMLGSFASGRRVQGLAKVAIGS